MTWLLDAYSDSRTYGSLVYSLLGLPIGIFGFIVVVTGFALGLGLPDHPHRHTDPGCDPAFRAGDGRHGTTAGLVSARRLDATAPAQTDV